MQGDTLGLAIWIVTMVVVIGYGITQVEEPGTALFALAFWLTVIYVPLYLFG